MLAPDGNGFPLGRRVRAVYSDHWIVAKSPKGLTALPHWILNLSGAFSPRRISPTTRGPFSMPTVSLATQLNAHDTHWLFRSDHLLPRAQYDAGIHEHSGSGS
jgi:hypothetical protein